jgi:hypothetical protein
MKVILENCSLEISHIGTTEEIDMQIAIERVMDGLVDFGKNLRAAVAAMCEVIGKCFCQIAESFRTVE